MANTNTLRSASSSQLTGADRQRVLVGIPCLNEEKTIAAVIQSIPREIQGISRVDIVVVDDGSDDRTGEIARQHGAKVIRHPHRRGLGRAFDSIVQHALTHGYDVMVRAHVCVV